MLLLCGQLCPQALIVLLKLRRVRSTEILGLKYLAYLDLRLPAHRVGAAFGPFDRLFLRVELPYPETSDQLLRLDEGAIDHCTLLAREPDTRTLRARVEPFPREHHASLDQFFIEFAHLGEQALIG